jgi:transposase-like protein
MSTYMDQILENLQAAQDKTNAANEDRYKQAMSIYDSIVKQYATDGDFQQGIADQMNLASTQAVSKSRHALVQSGLGNVSSRKSMKKKFEEGPAKAAKARAEDARLEGEAKARSAKAGFIERKEDVGPDPNSIAQLAAQSGSRV